MVPGFGDNVSRAHPPAWAPHRRRNGLGRLYQRQLLDEAERAGFETLVTCNQNFVAQQNLAGRNICVVVFSTNTWLVIPAQPQSAVANVHPRRLRPSAATPPAGTGPRLALLRLRYLPHPRARTVFTDLGRDIRRRLPPKHRRPAPTQDADRHRSHSTAIDATARLRRGIFQPAPRAIELASGAPRDTPVPFSPEFPIPSPPWLHAARGFCPFRTYGSLLTPLKVSPLSRTLEISVASKLSTAADAGIFSAAPRPGIRAGKGLCVQRVIVNTPSVDELISRGVGSRAIDLILARAGCEVCCPPNSAWSCDPKPVGQGQAVFVKSDQEPFFADPCGLDCAKAAIPTARCSFARRANRDTLATKGISRNWDWIGWPDDIRRAVPGTGDHRWSPVSPGLRWRLAIPHKVPPLRRVTSASPTAPTAAPATITAAASATIADSIIHPIVPDKNYLSPFDPPNPPPPARRQTARKPGSVPPAASPPRGGDGHSSGTPVAGRLVRPTRAAARRSARHLRDCSPMPAAPTWSCSRWGLPCHRRCRRRGAPLPHRFTLAARPARRCGLGGVLSVALSLGSPPPGVTRHRTSVEPGLSSPRSGRRAAIRPSGG